jgi:hypothetical protein
MFEKLEDISIKNGGNTPKSNNELHPSNGNHRGKIHIKPLNSEVYGIGIELPTSALPAASLTG